jgi:hypothetical protein
MPTVFTALCISALIVCGSASVNAQSLAKLHIPVKFRTGYVNDVDVTAMRHFLKHFGFEAKETWSEVDHAGYRASFRSHNVVNLVDYNNRGAWISTLKIYNQSALARGIKAIVKANYKYFNIISVTELSSRIAHMYFISIQDRLTLKMISVMDGEVKLLQDFTRGDIR